TLTGVIQNNVQVGGGQSENDTTNNTSINAVQGATATPTVTPTRTPRPQATLTPTPSGRYKTLVYIASTGYPLTPKILAKRLDTGVIWQIPVGSVWPTSVAVDPTQDRLYW